MTCMLINKVHYLSTKLINVIIMFTIPLKVIMVKLCYIYRRNILKVYQVYAHGQSYYIHVKVIVTTCIYIIYTYIKQLNH